MLKSAKRTRSPASLASFCSAARGSACRLLARALGDIALSASMMRRLRRQALSNHIQGQHCLQVARLQMVVSTELVVRLSAYSAYVDMPARVPRQARSHRFISVLKKLDLLLSCQFLDLPWVKHRGSAHVRTETFGQIPACSLAESLLQDDGSCSLQLRGSSRPPARPSWPAGAAAGAPEHACTGGCSASGEPSRQSRGSLPSYMSADRAEQAIT